MSFNLPHTIEVNKQLPKKAIFCKFGLKAAQRDAFDRFMQRAHSMAMDKNIGVPQQQ